MGLETIAIIGLTALQARSSMRQAEDQAEAVVSEANINAENRGRQTRMNAARQQVSFLNSGLTLEGTPMAAIQNTFSTGITDINQITTNANKQAKNIMGAARMEAISSFAKMGMGMSFGGGDNIFSGSNAFGAQGSVSRAIAGFNDTTINGITSTDAYGPMKNFGGF